MYVCFWVFKLSPVSFDIDSKFNNIFSWTLNCLSSTVAATWAPVAAPSCCLASFANSATSTPTASANALTLFKAQNQSDIILALNKQTNINMYYNAKINGGTLNDAAGLKDGTIPDNKKALRNNLAQQVLHEKMVDMQYNKWGIQWNI